MRVWQPIGLALITRNAKTLQVRLVGCPTQHNRHDVVDDDPCIRRPIPASTATESIPLKDPTTHPRRYGARSTCTRFMQARSTQHARPVLYEMRSRAEQPPIFAPRANQTIPEAVA